ncbi:MAG TPA: UvrD-helicase domain-containing protein, partial [Thermoanaerobaculia bacterium]|nr:UvrD-helicase domain-containing protein [Thermoanaerobaculia bacterium]
LAERAAAKPFGRSEEVTIDRIAAEVLSRVVAITFTEAAAAEMAGRTARELALLASSGEVPSWLDASLLPSAAERVARARALLGTLDHLVVRTIHAFCRGLLGEHPLEAGVHPDLVIDADGSRVEQIVQEIVEDSLRESYGTPGDPHLLALAALGFGPREIVEALIALLGSGLPSGELATDPLGPDAVRAFRDRLAAACRQVHGLIAPRLRKARGKNVRKIEEGLATLIDRLSRTVEIPVSTLKEWAAELLPENLRGHLHEWARKRKEADLFGDVLDELAAAADRLDQYLGHLGCLDPELLEHGRLALRPLLAAVEAELRTQGIATFDFLLTGAEQLLARQPEVRRQVRRRIDQLLVDEFQDTDRIQCDFLRWIALDGPVAERPGLFLVGDPKQSIFGWRNADLRAYDGFVAMVREAGGEVMSLVENFRSVPVILEEVARVIEPVMLHREGVQPPFEPLLACERRQGDPGFVRDGAARGGGWAPVEHWISWKAEGEKGAGRTTASEATQIEATALAADLRSLHEQHGVRWKEIAILLRSTGDLDLYLEELRRARVPFAVGRDKQYYRRREVIEAAALVRAILDPGDHLALLTVLRSATVGVPDAALIPLWNQQFPKLMTELEDSDPDALAMVRQAVEDAARATPKDVPGIERVDGWEHNLLAAVESLALLRRSFATETADVFVERLRGLTLVEATEAARYLGPYRLANLERFFRQLLATMEEGGGDVTAILRALRRSVAEAKEAEEGRPTEGSEDAVAVLTIHGAKGLDFEHVYLVQLHKAPPPGDSGSRTEAGRTAPTSTVAGGFEYRLFGAPTLGFDRVEAERREVEAAERVRLLYVGMTRAKDRVVLAGTWPDRPGRSAAKPWDQAHTPLDLLLSRRDLPGDLHARWEEALAADASPAWTFTDTAGALWKFPALRPTEVPGLAAEPERPGLPGPEEIALVSSGLRAERARSAVRMARRFGGAASEEAHALLREQQAERFTSERSGRREPRDAGDSVVDRPAAMAAGGAIHRALEEWDFAADPRQETGRQRSLLPGYLAALVEGDELDRSLPLAESLLESFAAGPFLARLRTLKNHILARELPILLPPGVGDRSPVGVVAGAIDLLYRNPDDGRIVIADYKTDEVRTEREVQARAAIYSSQGELYARAIREALELAENPRFELWFLRPGVVFAPPGCG